MESSELIENVINKQQEDLCNANQTLGALHVLIRLALADAKMDPHSKELVNILKMADNLILRGHLSGGTYPGDIAFGRD